MLIQIIATITKEGTIENRADDILGRNTIRDELSEMFKHFGQSARRSRRKSP